MLNVVCLMGRLAADPELRHTQTGVSVTSFRIAVDRTYQPKGGQEKLTDWIDIVAWRNTADFVCKYFHKGSMIAVNGSLQTRQYTDRDGNRRTAVEVVADNVFFGESKRSEGGAYGASYGEGGGWQNNASAPVAAPQFSESPTAFSTAGSNDFEEIVGDDELPF